MYTDNFKQPLVSIITVVYNNEKYIENAIKSVISQDYNNIEYVVIDGGSTDGTIKKIESCRELINVFVSGKDKGVYDALNKGIENSSGEIIGILHSDDVFSDEHVVSEIINKMMLENAELAFSDLVIINQIHGKIIRYYKAKYFKRWMFRIGWLPPHPTCFVRRKLYEEFGGYKTHYKIAGDFDFLVRAFYGRDIKWTHVDRVCVKMRSGGMSNLGLSSKILNAQEISQSLKENNVWSLKVFQFLRYLIRLIEFINRPRNYRYN